MVNTLEISLRSILGQIDDEYEIVVVDGGSNDGSQKKLEEMSEEYTELRIILRDRENQYPLGVDRNLAISKASGDYILANMDMDDVYRQGIQEFVDIFHMVEEKREDYFLLQGDSIKIANKNLFLDFPFRDFRRGEDVDHWERLYAAEAIIWLDHKRFWEPVGYPHGIIDRIRNNYESKVSFFRSGKSLESCIEYAFVNNDLYNPKLYFHLCTYAAAFLDAQRRGCYEPNEGFRSRGRIGEVIAQEKRRLPEIAEEYGIQLEEEPLTARQEELFLDI